MLKKLSRIILLICFFSSTLMPIPKAQAAPGMELPVPGTMVHISPAFEPVLMKGIKINPDNPFKFDFVLDTGNTNFKATDTQLKAESERLIKYFLAAMTVPEKDLWVNLSPYEKNRMIADNLGQTDMGRDLLAQDYILKQLTASLIYPEKELGKKFWDSVYAKAQHKFGTSEIPVNTFNKVWIVADKADIFERGNVAYIVGAHLKVMLEEDYLATSKNQSQPKRRQPGDMFQKEQQNVSPSPLPSDKASTMKAPQGNPPSRNVSTSSLSSQIIKEIILPEIEKEINQGQNFAPLRQMYYSMILASWYKVALKDAMLTQIYGNQSKVKVGINAEDLTEKDKIFDRYLQAYKKGVFNYIKEDVNGATQQATPRKYFSGGTSFAMLATKGVMHRNMPFNNSAMVGNILDVNVDATPAKIEPSNADHQSFAMISLPEKLKKELEEILQSMLEIPLAKTDLKVAIGDTGSVYISDSKHITPLFYTTVTAKGLKFAVVMKDELRHGTEPFPIEQLKSESGWKKAIEEIKSEIFRHTMDVPHPDSLISVAVKEINEEFTNEQINEKDKNDLLKVQEDWLQGWSGRNAAMTTLPEQLKNELEALLQSKLSIPLDKTGIEIDHYKNGKVEIIDEEYVYFWSEFNTNGIVFNARFNRYRNHEIVRKTPTFTINELKTSAGWNKARKEINDLLFGNTDMDEKSSLHQDLIHTENDFKERRRKELETEKIAKVQKAWADGDEAMITARMMEINKALEEKGVLKGKKSIVLSSIKGNTLEESTQVTIFLGPLQDQTFWNIIKRIKAEVSTMTVKQAKDLLTREEYAAVINEISQDDDQWAQEFKTELSGLVQTEQEKKDASIARDLQEKDWSRKWSFIYALSKFIPFNAYYYKEDRFSIKDSGKEKVIFLDNIEGNSLEEIYKSVLSQFSPKLKAQYKKLGIPDELQFLFDIDRRKEAQLSPAVQKVISKIEYWRTFGYYDIGIRIKVGDVINYSSDGSIKDIAWLNVIINPRKIRSATEVDKIMRIISKAAGRYFGGDGYFDFSRTDAYSHILNKDNLKDYNQQLEAIEEALGERNNEAMNAENQDPGMSAWAKVENHAPLLVEVKSQGLVETNKDYWRVIVAVHNGTKLMSQEIYLPIALEKVADIANLVRTKLNGMELTPKDLNFETSVIQMAIISLGSKPSNEAMTVTAPSDFKGSKVTDMGPVYTMGLLVNRFYKQNFSFADVLSEPMKGIEDFNIPYLVSKNTLDIYKMLSNPKVSKPSMLLSSPNGRIITTQTMDKDQLLDHLKTQTKAGLIRVSYQGKGYLLLLGLDLGPVLLEDAAMSVILDEVHQQLVQEAAILYNPKAKSIEESVDGISNFISSSLKVAAIMFSKLQATQIPNPQDYVFIGADAQNKLIFEIRQEEVELNILMALGMNFGFLGNNGLTGGQYYVLYGAQYPIIMIPKHVLKPAEQTKEEAPKVALPVPSNEVTFYPALQSKPDKGGYVYEVRYQNKPATLVFETDHNDSKKPIEGVFKGWGQAEKKFSIKGRVSNIPSATQLITILKEIGVVSDEAMNVDQLRGGIDLDRNKMKMNVKKDATMGGVNVKFDKAMIQQIQQNGFDGLNFKINSILPTSIPILLGFQQRKEEQEELAKIS